MDIKKEPLYETIISDLKTKILNGEYKPDDRLPTEMDLAERYGVSRITSKRALEELKQLGFVYRIRGSGSFVAAQRPSAETGSQPAGNSNIVAIILPFDDSNGSFALSVRGIAEVLESRGYYMSVYNGMRDVKAVENLIAKLYRDGIGGIIYYPLSEHDNFSVINMLYLENYPIVTIDKYFESIPISYVVSDNETGGATAVEYLIAQGHSRIGFVSDLSIETISSLRNRYFGYCKTLKAHRIPFDSDLVKLGVTGNEFSRTYQRDVYQPLLRDLVDHGATAVFAVIDLIASYLIRAAFELGIRIPEDISIIGFDDMDISKHLQPPLTTVSQSFFTMGKEAARILCDEIQSGQTSFTQRRLPVELVVRDSCKNLQN